MIMWTSNSGSHMYTSCQRGYLLGSAIFCVFLVAKRRTNSSYNSHQGKELLILSTTEQAYTQGKPMPGEQSVNMFTVWENLDIQDNGQ